MTRVNFHLTERQMILLREMADSTGLSVAEIIRRAIDAYLDRIERRAKAAGE